MRKAAVLWALGALLGVSLLATPAAMSAEDTYGDAGCGLGSMLFGNEPGFVQVFAATTNGFLGNQTFGITSGTLNCEGTKGGSDSARVFIEANREALAKDIARGSGETISGLSAIAGCSDATAVGSTLQQEFGAIFPHEKVSDAEVQNAILGTLRSTGSLACKNLG